MKHRIVPNFRAQAEQIGSREVVDHLLQSARVTMNRRCAVPVTGPRCIGSRASAAAEGHQTVDGYCLVYIEVLITGHQSSSLSIKNMRRVMRSAHRLEGIRQER